MILLVLCFIFSDLVTSLSNLAHTRLPGALATSTQRAYNAMFRLYLAFLTFIDLHPSKVNVDVILAFLECLNFNSVGVSQINNYVSAIKCFSLRFNLPMQYLEHQKISLYLRSLQKTTPANIKLKRCHKAKKHH